MNKIKKLVLYLIVILLVGFLSFLFIKIFAFNKAKNQEEIKPEITEELVNKLYNYLPTKNDYNLETMYSSYYTTAKTISYSLISNMIYEYIYNYDSFKLEKVETNEIKTVSTPIYKINKNEFLKDLKIIFGNDIKYSLDNFKIDLQTEAIIQNDYVYILNNKNQTKNDYIILKDRLSYTVADNNKTIKIYDYYLKCNVSSGLCYNDEKLNKLNTNIKYQENIDINLYKDYFKEYEHIFKYDNETQTFYWESSNEVKEES